MIDVAALFVERHGTYAGMDGVDLWTVERDARRYPGPHPVVAHPPCNAWSILAYSNVRRTGRQVGEDGGCFAAALAAVRKHGGVLEHPWKSRAWAAHGLLPPPYDGGWTVADWEGGWTCRVDQGHYGHIGPKPTWLYAVGVDLPQLMWSRSLAGGRVEFMPRAERSATPPDFASLLIRMARSVAR